MGFSNGMLSLPQIVSNSASVNSGVFTPVLLDSALDPNLGQTYLLQLGRFTTLEGFVTLTVNLIMDDLGSLSLGDPAAIGGLPFPVGPGPAPQAMSGYAQDIFSDTTTSLVGTFDVGNTHMDIKRWFSGFGSETHPIGFLTRSSVLQFSGAYQI